LDRTFDTDYLATSASSLKFTALQFGKRIINILFFISH